MAGVNDRPTIVAVDELYRVYGEHSTHVTIGVTTGAGKDLITTVSEADYLWMTTRLAEHGYTHIPTETVKAR